MGAIIKSAGGSSKGGTGGLESYLKQDEKTEKNLMYGKDCDIKSFSKDFQLTKELYNKTEGRQHIHLVQSWGEGEISPKKANEIGQEFLKHDKFKGFQAVCITHTDKKNVHNHIVINSVNLETGLKYRQSKGELETLKKFSNELNLKIGIEPEQKKQEKGQVRAYSKNKYKAIEGHFKGILKSYVVETALAVDKCLKSENKQEFVNKMEKLGFKTIWEDTKKYITFENQEGKKVRLSNLEKTFSDNKYSKEGLENEFERFKGEREQERGGTTNLSRNLERNGENQERKYFSIGNDKTANTGNKERKERPNEPIGRITKERNGDGAEYKRGNGIIQTGTEGNERNINSKVGEIGNNEQSKLKEFSDNNRQFNQEFGGESKSNKDFGSRNINENDRDKKREPENKSNITHNQSNIKHRNNFPSNESIEKVQELKQEKEKELKTEKGKIFLNQGKIEKIGLELLEINSKLKKLKEEQEKEKREEQEKQKEVEKIKVKEKIKTKSREQDLEIER